MFLWGIQEFVPYGTQLIRLQAHSIQTVSNSIIYFIVMVSVCVVLYCSLDLSCLFGGGIYTRRP